MADEQYIVNGHDHFLVDYNSFRYDYTKYYKNWKKISDCGDGII